jgi:hypothetical protein
VLDLATRSFEFTLLADFVKEKAGLSFGNCNFLFSQWGGFEDFVLATLTFENGFGNFEAISDNKMW